MLLDEPTANLDVRFQLEVFRSSRTARKRGLTVVVALHDYLGLALLRPPRPERRAS